MISVLLEIMATAQDAVLHVYQDAALFNASTKQDSSPVTQADIIANEIIIAGLKKHFPYPILSEESQDDLVRLSSNTVWLVDPLDGTKEFLSRNGEFTINIALIENHRPVVGVISVPAKNKVYYASSNAGAFVVSQNEHTKIECSQQDNIKNARLSVSRSHLSPDMKNWLKKSGFTHILAKGSALKYCSIAEGESDASVRKTPLMEWDIAAADCILSEAGGVITDFEAQELRYNNLIPKLDNGIIASNRHLFQELILLHSMHAL